MKKVLWALVAHMLLAREKSHSPWWASIIFTLISSSLPISRFANKIPLLMQLGPVDGAVFADYGSDLGSGPTVPGTFLLPFPGPIKSCTIMNLSAREKELFILQRKIK